MQIGLRRGVIACTSAMSVMSVPRIEENTAMVRPLCGRGVGWEWGRH